MKNSSLCRTCNNFNNGCNLYTGKHTEFDVYECNDYRRGAVNQEFKKQVEEKTQLK
jgi:hypothetical protein